MVSPLDLSPGITTLNLKLFLPLLEEYSIIAPDVIGMPGKSDPYRNISSKKDEYGLWIKEVLNHYKEERISFAVSSYSSAMFLSFAKRYPEMRPILWHYSFFHPFICS